MYSISDNYSLQNHNTFGLPARADHFVRCNSAEDIALFIADNPFPEKPMLILGEGSNILFVEDFRGVVLNPAIRNITISDETVDTVAITAGAGLNWDEFVAWCVERNYGGIENLSLIPGAVGAAPIQNIGAYGAEAGDVISEVHYIDAGSGKEQAISNEDCQFAYRSSIFKRELKNRVIITDVVFRLSKKPLLKTTYGNISSRLSDIKNPGISDIRKTVIDIRNEKLPDPAKTGNAGSFFKNPVIERGHYEELRQYHPEIPSYPVPEKDQVKIPAAWLIEKCGLKGITEGNTGTWHKQPLVVVNHGSATGREILSFAEKIRKSVDENFGIRLETEVNIMYSAGSR